MKLSEIENGTMQLVFMVNQGADADRLIEEKSTPDSRIYEMEATCEDWILARKGLAKKIAQIDPDNRLTVYDFTDGRYPVKQACETTGHIWIKVTK